MEITIKKATIDDLKEIQELSLKLFEKEYKEYDSSLDLDWTLGKTGTKFFKNRITKEDGCVLIAIVENKVVGYLCGWLKKAESYRKLPTIAELENTFVLVDFRSKGAGGKLYREFVKWFKSKGVGKIKVEASAQNELGIKFYRKNNFKDYSLILETNI